MQENSVKAKMNHHAKHFRFVSRAQAFQQKRKTYDQLDYLAYYPPEVREAILYSMQAPVPDPLPPLGLSTISLYRRSRLPVFKPINPETGQLEGHMTYESLWILSSLEQKSFIDYQSVVKEFQRDLCLYLSANSTDIQQMAVIAAGNKIIGKEKDILGIVEKDARQLWVLANHIYQNRISFTKIFAYLTPQHELAFKTLFELSMLFQNEVAETVVADGVVVDRIMTAIDSGNDAITNYALRIVGNIVAVKDEYISTFCKRKILERLASKLSSSNGQVRRDTCWLISNLLTKKASATLAIQNSELMTKLIDLFSYEVLLNIKKEITYIFCYLAYYADRKEALLLLGHPNVLQICYSQLCIEDIDLNVATLLLLKEILEVGESFKNEEEENVMKLLMKQARALCNEVSKKSYSQNNEVSSISLQILGLMDEDQ